MPIKRTKNGKGDSRFTTFLKKSGIKHIKARVNHLQTNGKVVKWYDTYEKRRSDFKDSDNFVNWYNTARYHENLDTRCYLQTQDDAFWSRLSEGCKLNLFLKCMKTEFNV